MPKSGFEFRSLQSLLQARRAPAVSLVLLLVSLCMPVHAETGAAAADQQRLAQFQQSLDSLRRQYGIPGLSAAIVSNGHDSPAGDCIPCTWQLHGRRLLGF